jgi:hypothetical protein
MTIAYSASTEGATFLLDEAGVCKRVMLKRAASNQQTQAGRTRAQAARMVVGAQYVASIDTRVEGGLVPMPRCGAAMLFAYADETGRLAVVRTAPIVRFEAVAQPDDTVPVPELDDECMTIPLGHPSVPSIAASLAQSGERVTPTWALGGSPPPSTLPELPPTWPKLPPDREVRLRKVSIVDPDEGAPTLRNVAEMRRPAGKGMLPRRR